MKRCPKCHEEVADDRRICRRCGSIVTSAKATESPAEQDTFDADVAAALDEVTATDTETSPASETMSAAAQDAESNEPAEGEWICAKCASPVPRDFAACWQCGTARDGTEDPGFPALGPAAANSGGTDPITEFREQMGHCPHGGPTPDQVQDEPYRRVACRRFQSTLSSWDSMCRDAADFAASVGPDRLISISHSEDNNDGVIIVWYWCR